MVDIFNGLKSDLLDGLRRLLAINQTIRQRANSLCDAVSKFDSEALDQARSIARFFDIARRLAEQKITKYHHDLLNTTELLMLLATQAESISKSVRSLRDVPMGPEILCEIHELRTEIEKAVQPIPPPQPHDDLFPPFAKSVFVVGDFRRAIDAARDPAAQQFVHTASNRVYGNLWRLKVYPFGNTNVRGTHVSIFVEMTSGPDEKAPYLYRMEIDSSDPDEMPVVREFRSEFVVNGSWGWNRSILIEKVTDQGFLNADGELVVTLYLKPETYCQAYKDIKVALDQEKEKYRALKATVQHPADSSSGVT
jgi:hypothetical protein